MAPAGAGAPPSAGSKQFIVPDVAQTLPRIFFQAAGNQRSRPFRNGAEIGLLSQDGRQDVAYRIAGKKRLCSQQLTEHHAERPDVGTLIDSLTARLLRTHVSCCAQNHARLGGAGQEGRRVVRQLCIDADLRQAEVQNLYCSVRLDFDVRRLEVAMDDAFFVRRFERGG